MAYEKVYGLSKQIAVQGHTGCAGCTESLVTNAIFDALDELGVDPTEVTATAPAGCSSMSYCSSFRGSSRGNIRTNWNVICGAHGRGHSIATGLKRVHPEKMVLVLQGDGDLAGIGLHDTIHAANRGENFTVFFQNNQVYGTTGGQMAPTTLVGQVTTTTPTGRDPALQGYPLHMAEMLAPLPGVKYVARVAFTDPKNVLFARKCIKKAIECQMKGIGYAIVETICACPTNWHMSIDKAYDYIKNTVENEYKIGELKTY